MRCRSISYLINCFHCGIDCSIKADGIICTSNILINSSRQTNCIDSQICQLTCSIKGTVTANYNDTINSVLSADLCTKLLTLLCTELCTSCCVKDSTTSLDNIRYAARIHINDLLFQQSGVTSHNTLYVQTLRNTGTNNGADCGVHAWSISSTC